VRAAGVADSAKVDIELLGERDVGEVRALLAPVVKLFRAAVGRNEFAVIERGEAAGVAEWQRAEQQGVDDAEDTGVCANADGQSGNRECSVPRTAGPKAEGVPDILRYFAGELQGNRYGQVGEELNPQIGKSPGAAGFGELVAKLLLHWNGIVRAKIGGVES